MTTKKAKKQEVMLRLPPETTAKLDTIVAQLRVEKQGLPVTRAGVCYMLLETALAAWNATSHRGPPGLPPEAPSPPEPACETCQGTERIGDDIPCPFCGPDS